MSRPDAIYWRRTMWHPEIEYANMENVWFWPGDGLCVDGYYYWHYKNWAKRVPRDVWIEWGRRRHAPPTEKHSKLAIPLRAFMEER